MPRTEESYRTVSLPRELVDAVRSLLEEYPELGYSSIADFIKEAVRSKFRVDAATALVLRNKYGKPAPRIADLKGKDLEAAYVEAIDLIASAASRVAPEEDEEILLKSGKLVHRTRAKKVD